MTQEQNNQRHKWKKKVDHPYCHDYICGKCGAEKDNKIIGNAIYWVGEEKHFKAPPCAPSTDYNEYLQTLTHNQEP